jgi:micrococcal nuclease
MRVASISLAIFITGCASVSYAHQVIGIADGHTLTLLVDRKPLKIRLSDINAPEKKQSFGQSSKHISGTAAEANCFRILRSNH